MASFSMTGIPWIFSCWSPAPKTLFMGQHPYSTKLGSTLADSVLTAVFDAWGRSSSAV